MDSMTISTTSVHTVSLVSKMLGFQSVTDARRVAKP